MRRVTDWPTKGHLVQRCEESWTVVAREASIPTPLPNDENLIIRGHIDDAFASLAASGFRFAAVCVDFPHIQTIDPPNAFGSKSIVLSLCADLFARTREVLAQGGSAFVLADCRTSPWIMAAADSQEDLKVCRLICWQKRYSGLQDKRREIDSSFDIIFEFRCETPASIEYELFEDEQGLRSEDATKFEQLLKDQGTYGHEVAPSKRAKPALLCERLIGRSPSGRILELMSDSGYFSAAAAAAGRGFVCAIDDHHALGRDALQRVRSRFKSIATEVSISDCHREEVPPDVLSTLRFVAESPKQIRRFDLVAFPHRLSAEGQFGEAIALVSESDPFIGLRGYLSRVPAAAILNTDGRRKDLVELVSAWFEASGLESACAIRGDLCSCLRLAAWATATYGLPSQTGLITHCVGKEPDWWLVITPTPRERRYAMQRPGKYVNPTEDPRGAYREEYKGARSGSDATKRAYNVPPYRFEIVGGQLPGGFCRIDRFSGVLHAPEANQLGTFPCVVRVTDSSGVSVEQVIEIHVVEEIRGAHTQSDTDVWWLDPPLKIADGPLSASFPAAVQIPLGHSISLVLRASGGNPFSGTVSPSDRDAERQDRFWPWSRAELVARILELRIGFGRKGDAKFQNRIFQAERATESVTVHSWWGKKNFEKWGVDSVTEGLRQLLCAPGTYLVCDSNEGTAKPTDLRVRYTLESPVSARIRMRGIPYPLFDEGVGVPELMASLGFLQTHAPESVQQFVQWLGVAPGRQEIAAVLTADLAPTTSLIQTLRQALERPASLLVLYFRGSPVRCDGTRFARIPFDADRV